MARDESYWQGDDGTLANAWINRARTVHRDPYPDPDAGKVDESCLTCKNDDSREAVGVTTKKKFTIYLCPVCDGSALDLHKAKL